MPFSTTQYDTSFLKVNSFIIACCVLMLVGVVPEDSWIVTVA